MTGDAPFSEEESGPHSGRGSTSWEPYQSPEGSGGSVLRLLRRYAFSITLVTAALAIGALIYFAPTRLAPEQGSSPPPNDPPTNDERRATLSVSSQPTGAAVIVGADTVGVTPIENHQLSPGTYLVTVDREDYESRDTVLTLSDGQSATFTPRFSQDESPFGGQDLTDASPPDSSLPSDDPVASSPPSPSTSDEPSGSAPDEAVENTPSETSSAPTDDGTTLATGTLVLRATPERTTVELDGSEVGSTPTTLGDVVARTYEVTFSQPGYKTVTRRVNVGSSDTVTVAATLERQTGHLRVLVRPWGSIYIDDQLHAENSDVWYDTSLPVGSHTITAEHPALGEMSQSVDVTARDTQSVVLDLREQ